MKRMTTRDQLNDWASDNYRIEQKCEGTPYQALMAGWVNATDIDTETKGKQTEAEFCNAAYHEFDNMGYE